MKLTILIYLINYLLIIKVRFVVLYEQLNFESTNYTLNKIDIKGNNYTHFMWTNNLNLNSRNLSSYLTSIKMINKDYLFINSSTKYQKRLAFNKKYQKPNLCKCQINKSQRIVGGEQIPQSTHIPWQVSLAERNSHFCAGSIVNNYFVLTAAHCVWDSKAPNVQVRVGINSLNDPSISKKTYRVDKIYVHPLYNDATDASQPGDIALLKLKSPLQFIEGSVEPACLGLQKNRKYNRLLATGWGSYLPTTSGTRNFPGKLSTNLKRAEFTLRSTCESSQLICIKPIQRGNSICDGDSGGPLHATTNSKTSVVGVCSFGLGRLQNGGIVKYCLGDGAYTKISSYKSFVTGKIGNSNYCSG